MMFYYQFFMNKYLMKFMLLNVIGSVLYQLGFIYIDLVLKYVMDYDFKLVVGDRDYVVNILVVMIDGQFNDRQVIIIQVNKFYIMNIKIFVIGIGSGINYVELEYIVIDVKYVFIVLNFDVLNILQVELKKMVCESFYIYGVKFVRLSGGSLFVV